MTKSELEGVDELQDVQEMEGDDSTDWKAEHQKLVEKAIKARERNKMLRENHKKLETDLETYKKAHPETQPQLKQESKPDDNRLLEKAFLRSAQITTEDEIELALSTAKKWDMPIDKLVDDEDFKIKLDKLRTQKSNELATSALKERGGTGKSSAKEDPAYWIAKGTPPMPSDIPDRKVRAKIAKAMMDQKKGIGANPYWNG